jgi:hypothetical protein
MKNILILKKNFIIDNMEESHQSYGMVSLANASFNRNIKLFGALAKHSNVLELTISKADIVENNYHSNYFAREKLVQIILTPAQLTQLLTRTNTSGIPCTIQYTKEDGRIELPRFEKKLKEELHENINLEIQEIKTRITRLNNTIEQDLKGQPNKTIKEKIKNDITQLYNQLIHNLDYLEDVQIKKLETASMEILNEMENLIGKEKRTQIIQDNITGFLNGK